MSNQGKNTRIFVGNLPWKATEEGLKAHFQSKGQTVANAKIITDRSTGRSKGFGFVEFETEEEAKQALAFDNSEFMDRTIRVSIAHEKERPEGGNGGGYGERSSSGYGSRSGGGGGGGGGERRNRREY